MALPGVNPTYRYLDDNAPDGTILGQTASALVGFFGATPSSQRAATNQAAPSASTAASFSATQWGFSTSTQADALVTCVRQLRSELVTLGLIKGSN
jgi:UDP-N-acetyl-D-mannosaminuronic acid transferase (WecB/TagA/CpsF family)